MSEQLLTAKEACAYLRVSYWTLLNKLIKEIPHIRMGDRGNIKFRKSTLDEYLKEQEKKSNFTTEQFLDLEIGEENIIELREKFKNKNKEKSIQEIMQTLKSKKYRG